MRLQSIGDDTREMRALIKKWNVSEELWQWSSQLRKTPVPWVTTHDWNKVRKDQVFHPSSAENKCDFFLWLEYVGAKSVDKLPPNTQLIMDSGTMLEHQYQYYQHTRAIHEGYFYDSSYPVWKHGELSTTLGLGGEADGLMERTLRLGDVDIEMRAIFEYKTINRDGFSGLRSKPSIKYVRQVHSYMASMDIPLTVIVYINRDNAEPKHFFSWFDPKIWTPIEERFQRIKKLADDYQEAEKNIGDSCKWCRFFEDCAPFPQRRKRRKLPGM